MNDELNLLKQQWQTIDLKVKNLEETNRRLIRKLALSKVTPMNQRLGLHYRRYGIMACLLLPAVGILMYYILTMPIWLCVVYGLFGLLIGVQQYVFGYRVLNVDYISLPTVDAVRMALKIKSRQQSLLAESMIAGAFVIWCLLREFWINGDKASFIGGMIGLAIGLTIGIKQQIHFRRLANRIVSQLNDCEKEGTADDDISQPE